MRKLSILALAVVFGVCSSDVTHAQPGKKPGGQGGRFQGKQRPGGKAQGKFRPGGKTQGKGRPGGFGGFNRGRFQPPLMKALDADGDGTISAAEISNAAQALATLDTNKDGKLTADELRPSGFGGGAGSRFGRGQGGFGRGRFRRGGPGGAQGKRRPGDDSGAKKKKKRPSI